MTGNKTGILDFSQTLHRENRGIVSCTTLQIYDSRGDSITIQFVYFLSCKFEMKSIKPIL